MFPLPSTSINSPLSYPHGKSKLHNEKGKRIEAHVQIQKNSLDNNYDGDADEDDSSDDYDEDLAEFFRSHTTSLPTLENKSTPPSHESFLKKKRKKRRSESDSTTNDFFNTKFNNKLPPPSPLEIDATFSDVPSLRAHCDLGNSVGRRRGVCGKGKGDNNSSIDKSYLEVTLFTLFYFQDQFDEWILDHRVSKGRPTHLSKEVRSLIKREILFSLRTSYSCPAQNVEKLFKALFPTTQPHTIEFSKFFRHFTETVLTLPETCHYTNGSSRLVHILKDSSSHQNSQDSYKSSKGVDNNLGMVSVQDLFTKSLVDLKLLSFPNPGLFLAIDTPLVVPHTLILPNIQLDLSPTLIQLSDENETDDSETGNRIVNLSSKNTDGKETFPLCRWLYSAALVVYEYLQNLVHQFPNFGNISFDSVDDSWSETSPLFSPDKRRLSEINDTSITPVSQITKKKNNKKAIIALDLMAVVCLEHCPTTCQNKYSVFTRCGQNPRRGWAPWVHFNPSEDGIPLVRKIENFGKWLKRLERKPEKVGKKEIPKDILTLLTTSTFFVYSVKHQYESQTTLLSFVNEI